MKPEQVIAAIIKLLYDVKAMRWAVADKAKLLAAIRQQLEEK